MSGAGTKKTSSHVAPAEKLNKSLSELEFTFENMKKMELLLIQSDHNTIKAATAEFIKRFMSLLHAKQIPIFLAKYQDLDETQLFDLHRFYTILNLFHVQLVARDIKFLLNDQKIDVEMILPFVYNSLQNSLKADTNEFNTIKTIVLKEIFRQKDEKFINFLNDLTTAKVFK